MVTYLFFERKTVVFSPFLVSVAGTALCTLDGSACFFEVRASLAFLPNIFSRVLAVVHVRVDRNSIFDQLLLGTFGWEYASACSATVTSPTLQDWDAVEVPPTTIASRKVWQKNYKHVSRDWQYKRYTRI